MWDGEATQQQNTHSPTEKPSLHNSTDRMQCDVRVRQSRCGRSRQPTTTTQTVNNGLCTMQVVQN